MSTIFQLFARRGAFFIAAALELFCAYLIIQYNSPQQTVYESTRSMYSSWWMGGADYLQSFAFAHSEKEQLMDENAKLLSQLPNAYYKEEAETQNIVDDSLRQRYTYVAADIINKTPLSANINFVINRGTIHGIEPHQGVVNADGVIGIVTQVSTRHARVMSLCHREFKLSAQLRHKSYFGSLSWLGGDTRFALLESIPEYAPVVVGDTIETTGFSNIFPTGIALGEVVDKEPKEGTNTFDITVQLFNDFFTVDHGYVVRNLNKEDLEKLDQ